MKNYIKQKNKGPVRIAKRGGFTRTLSKVSGFTLVETMIAVFILTVAISGVTATIANGLFAARYANNEITANYLLQEAVDYIRYERDTIAFQKFGGGTWNTFLAKYGSPTSTCFAAAGCKIEPALGTISVCGSSSFSGGSVVCETLNYDINATNKDFYTYQTGTPAYPTSNFKRQIKMSQNSTLGANELDVLVTVEWLNGNLVRSKTLRSSLLNWQ